MEEIPGPPAYKERSFLANIHLCLDYLNTDYRPIHGESEIGIEGDDYAFEFIRENVLSRALTETFEGGS